MNDSDFVKLVEKAFGNIPSSPPVQSIVAHGRRQRQRHRVGGIGLALGLPIAVLAIVMSSPWSGASPPAAGHIDSTQPIISTDTSSTEGFMRALVGGELRMSSDGCLYAAQGSKTYDVLWPFGYTAKEGANGIVQVFDGQGRLRVEVGHVFQGSGGFLPESDLMRCRVAPPRAVMVIQVEIRDLSSNDEGSH
ncbi:MAG: hypothetical protein WKF73_11600 [Nocardioidaceae bacterium]